MSEVQQLTKQDFEPITNTLNFHSRCEHFLKSVLFGEGGGLMASDAASKSDVRSLQVMLALSLLLSVLVLVLLLVVLVVTCKGRRRREKEVGAVHVHRAVVC